MSITGLSPGVFDFSVIATGLAGAIETDRILVDADGVVPLSPTGRRRTAGIPTGG